MHSIQNDADLSDKGVEQSGSAMVNYLYELENVSANHEKIVATGHITASQDVKILSKNITPMLREKINVQSTL